MRLHSLLNFVIAIVIQVLINCSPAKAEYSSNLKVEHVESGTQYRAVIISRDRAVLAAEMAGRIIKMPFSTGDKFKKNDILVYFDCRLIEYNQIKAQREEEGTRRKWESVSELLKNNSTGRLNVDLAYVEFKKAEAENNAAKTLVDRCFIKAPFEGDVIRQAVQNFENVTIGQPVIEVVGSQVIEVESAVPAPVAMSLKGDEDFTFNGDQSSVPQRGHLVAVSPVIDPVSQLVTVRGVIDQKDVPVVIGVTGNIELVKKK